MRILAVSYGGAHANALAPVIHRLRSRGYEVLVVGLTTALESYRSHGINALSMGDVLTNLPSSQAMLACGDWAISHCGWIPNGQVSESDTRAYLGAGLWSLEQLLGRRQARELFAKKGRYAFCPDAFAEEVLEQLSPDLLLTTNSPRSEKAFVKAAQKLAIKAAVMVEGFAEIEKAWLSKPNYADALFVFNSWVKARLVEDGRSADQIVVTGSPAYDRLANIQPKTTKRLRVLYLSQNESLIGEVCSNQAMSGLPRQIVSALAKIAKQTEIDVEVRFHPNQDMDSIGDLMGLEHYPKAMLEDRLAVANVVITASSSTGIEAQLLGKPVVEIGWSKRSGLVPFHATGPHIRAMQPEQLTAAISEASRIVGNKNPLLGQATEAVVSQIEKLLQ